MSKRIKPTSLKLNILLSTAYKLLKMLSMFITAPHISRALGADGVGTYSYIYSIVTWFVLFAGLGTMVYGSIEIAKVRDDVQKRSQVFYEVELLSVAASVISLAAWLVFVFVFQNGSVNYLLLSAVIVATLFDISWFFAGIEQFKYSIIRSSIITILGIVAQLVFVRKPEDFTIYVFILCSTSLLSSVSIWAYIPRFLVKVPLKQLNITRHLKGTLLFFIPSVATSVFLVLDKTLIGVITKSMYENGYYEQAVKVTNFTQTLAFTGLNAVLGSRISYLYARGKTAEVKQRINKSVDYIVFIGVGACLGIIGTATRFVPVFFGADYGETIYILMILSPLVLIMGLSNTLGGQYYNPAGLRAKSARYILVGAAVNLGLNLLLIPFYGAFGAAVASIVGELVETLLYVFHCGEYFRPRTILAVGWKKLIAGTGMFLVLFLVGRCFSNSLVTLIIQVPLGILTYCGLLVLLHDSLINASAVKGFIGRFDIMHLTRRGR